MTHAPPIPPELPEDLVARQVAERFGLRGRLERLVSYADQNFRLSVGEGGGEYVVKIGRSGEGRELLDCQHAALEALKTEQWPPIAPSVQRSLSGEDLVEIQAPGGARHWLRLLTYLPGRLLADCVPAGGDLLRSWGQLLGRVDRKLLRFSHPAAQRIIPWDLCQAGTLLEQLDILRPPVGRALVQRNLLRFETDVAPRLARFRRSVIHNDGNEHNVLVSAEAEPRATSIIDFGDLLIAPTICELGIALAYAMLGQETPLDAAAKIVGGYHAELPLTSEEIAVVLPLALTRLCISVIHSARAATTRPDDEYVRVSEAPAWELLQRLAGVSLRAASADLHDACGLGGADGGRPTRDSILETRSRHLGPSLSSAYQSPLHIVGGARQYLFDGDGRAYLDLVNNVCHVGHSHPRVVAALRSQAADLNTNTRTLHGNLAEYLERLLAKFPAPLDVCFLVCTGSEANELALRLARAHSGARDVVVVEGAYHGNTSALVDLSPYKYDGPGGAGRASWVRSVTMPDPYRGAFPASDPGAGTRYAEAVKQAVESLCADGRAPAAFLCESLLGCGGQIVLPPGYLKAAYQHAQSAGAVCIADEVQVGFGRVGEHFWGFETQSVIPDIVTLGKPMGNGHPLAAVITRREIAESFANGMEYFNTFGGNPVSCAVGLAVLDVIEEEGLQEHAREVGAKFLQGLQTLAGRHPLIGDVRGKGLFLGIELVQGRETKEPAAAEATEVCEAMRERGILISTDGPLHNVLKIKPPLVVEAADVDRTVEELDAVLGGGVGES